MANYRLKGIFHSGQPTIHILFRKKINTMQTWRLGVTIALLVCGLGLIACCHSLHFCFHSEFLSA